MDGEREERVLMGRWGGRRWMVDKDREEDEESLRKAWLAERSIGLFTVFSL